MNELLAWIGIPTIVLSAASYAFYVYKKTDVRENLIDLVDIRSNFDNHRVKLSITTDSGDSFTGFFDYRQAHATGKDLTRAAILAAPRSDHRLAPFKEGFLSDIQEPHTDTLEHDAKDLHA